MATLFDPIRYGAIEAPNRIVMAPLTRGRATRDHVPTGIMADYYTQRAEAGLIITEGTGISREGLGWPYAPGLWTDEQVKAWCPVTAAVRAAGGRIVAQLWHMGRVVHPSVGGARPISASTIAAPGEGRTYDGMAAHIVPRELLVDEIPRLLDDYRRSARNAMEAGFDGVQVHAANGYLIDQFLRDSSNSRTDLYGGSIANRIRLLEEVTVAVIDEIGADRTGVRLSPNGMAQGVNDSAPHVLFPAAAAALSALGIAFLEIREPTAKGGFFESDADPIAPAMRAAFDGPLILNSDYDFAKAEGAIDKGEADAISFGRLFIANPDLVRRFSQDLPMAMADFTTFYTQGTRGYSDYPSSLVEPI